VSIDRDLITINPARVCGHDVGYVTLVFIDRDLITINHARVCGHDAGYVISVYRP
jgi:hypothetical protein